MYVCVCHGVSFYFTQISVLILFIRMIQVCLNYLALKDNLKQLLLMHGVNGWSVLSSESYWVLLKDLQ